LYEWSLKKVPDDTLAALRRAQGRERDAVGKKTLTIMLQSADAAARESHLVCTDVGIPTYSVKIGTRVQFDGPVRQAIVDGFADLVARIDPPILKMVTNPLTHERSYAGRNMPIVSFDLIDDADHVEIACAPKAMGTGRWEAIETFVYPTHETIEKFVLDTVLTAGSQPCPPIVTSTQPTKPSRNSCLTPCSPPAASPARRSWWAWVSAAPSIMRRKWPRSRCCGRSA